MTGTTKFAGGSGGAACDGAACSVSDASLDGSGLVDGGVDAEKETGSGTGEGMDEEAEELLAVDAAVLAACSCV